MNRLDEGIERLCVCHTPNDEQLYIQCSECMEWFHPLCIGLDSKTDFTSYVLSCDGHKAEDLERTIYESEDIYKNGYQIFRNELPLDSPLIKNRLDHKDLRVIFNHNEDNKKNDGKRKQKSIIINDNFLNDILRKIGIEKTERTWSLLFSEKNCQRQNAHVDYNINFRTHKPNSFKISHGCIVCIENGTKFDVWSGAHLIPSNSIHCPDEPVHMSTIDLNIGDVLIFRADCVHAGSAYIKPNSRLHCYCDVDGYKHTKNRV